MAGEKVRMKVREEHMPDGAAGPRGILQVLFNVALRINHRSSSGLFVRN